MQRCNLPHEGSTMSMINRAYDEYHGITAVLITLNEEDYIERCLKQLKPLVSRIVIIDGGSTDRTVEVAKEYANAIKISKFTGHFGNQKNLAMQNSFTDWTLFLDADEMLSDELAGQLNKLTDQDEYDCYFFPRIELIDDQESDGVYPDYQARLFRTYCRYVRPVHEELVGFKNSKYLKDDHSADLMHRKTMVRHISRNNSYGFFEMHYTHEIGCPGEQLKDTRPKTEAVRSV